MNELFKHQQEALDFLIKNPKSLCIIQMGGGKTRIVIELLKKLKLKNVFIVSLANIIKNTWTEELEKWEFPYEYKLYSTKKSLLDYMGGVALANIDIAAPVIKKWSDKLDALIIDESSILKTPQTLRFKYLKDIKTPRIHMLSALPAPNGFHNLWTQAYILDKGERLGKSYNHFINNNFITKEVRAYIHAPVGVRDGHDNIILDKIKDISYVSSFERLRPYRVVEDSIHFKLPILTTLVYRKVKKEGVYKDLVLSDAGSRFTKLRQLLSGFIYVSQNSRALHDSRRIDVLKDVLRTCKGYIIIIYNFIAEKEDIIGLLERMKVSFSIKAKDFIKGDFRCFVANSKSVGMGLNLQKANNLIWYSQTLSFEALFQMRGRIDRTGQKSSVFIYHLLSDNDLEKHITNSLNNKMKVKDMIEEFFKKQNINNVKYTRSVK